MLSFRQPAQRLARSGSSIHGKLLIPSQPASLRPARVSTSSRASYHCHAGCSTAPSQPRTSKAYVSQRSIRSQSDFPALQNRCASTSASSSRGPLNILGEDHATDDYTNIPSSILSRLAPSPTLPYSASHPLALLRSQIEGHFGPSFDAIAAPSPVVTTQLNFEDLGFPADHPGRSPTDTYYVNRSTCLRTHTSAHEVQTFARGHTHWLLTADVYRRDEIDSSHYPIFHQMEGAAIFSSGDYAQGGRVQRECEEMEARLAQANLEIEDKVDVEEAGGWQAGHNPEHAALAMRHLKGTLNGLVLELFGERHRQETAAAAAANSSSGENASSDPLRVRWISATFPFTSPSFEVEVWFRGKWLEILGCGVVKERTLDSAKVQDKLGWAFGLGLERIAMVLYSIPDIRLFWSNDPRFLSQFESEPQTAPPSSEAGVSAAGQAGAGKSGSKLRKLVTFRPYSRFPPCYKDVSFWVPEARAADAGSPAAVKPFHENDFCEIVRDQAADLAEDVRLLDSFTHPKTGRKSLCYRLNYRSMDRSLENEEVNALHDKVVHRLVDEMGLEIR